MSIEKLLCLDNKTPECRSFLTHALRWLDDPTMYGTFDTTPKLPRFDRSKFDALKGIKFSPLFGLPSGFVDAFMHVEASKDPNNPFRLRPIMAPDANDGIPQGSLQEVVMARRSDIRRDGSVKPEMVVQFDMESCYDQFALGERVRPLMCLLGPDGIVYALDRLAMGLRPACEVAQATLWFLLDFERHESVKVSSYIDNIRFAGPRTHTVAAIATFLDRCKRVGVQLDQPW